MAHLVLLGDSIFDNAIYTKGGPDVVSQVRRLLPPEWNASLLAVDGVTTDGIASQMKRLPVDATHLVLSIGGNNALKQEDVLHGVASSTAQALCVLADVVAEFEKSYRSCIELCLRPGLPLAVCTIYNGCIPEPQYQRVVTTALMLFNDVILRVAIKHALAVVDLRAICINPEDYANPIEPSSVGGQKIARVLAALVTGSTLHSGTTRVVTA